MEQLLNIHIYNRNIHTYICYEYIVIQLELNGFVYHYQIIKYLEETGKAMGFLVLQFNYLKI